MGESNCDPGGGTGRQLRQSTIAHQPGRYAEMLVKGVEKPAFTIPDPIFDPEPARHCAFPTIDLDQHPGPSELFKEARTRGEVFYGQDTQGQYPFTRNNSQDDQPARPALVVHLPPLPEDNEVEEDVSVSGDYQEDSVIDYQEDLVIQREPMRGESFKDYCLAVSQGLDWGSPEPEPEPELPVIYNSNHQNLPHPEIEPASDDWSQITLGVQWAIIATLCQVHPFSVAVRKLQLTDQQVTAFVQKYVECNDIIADWCDKIDRTPVSDLIRSAEDDFLCADEYVHLSRPELPTDILFLFQVEQARNFLRKIRHSELIPILGRWRGTSRNFVELPIQPDILAFCRSELYKTREFSVQDFRPITDREPISWLQRVHSSSDFDVGLSHFWKCYGNPFANTPNTVNPADLQQTSQHDTSAKDTSMGRTQIDNQLASARDINSPLPEAPPTQRKASLWFESRADQAPDAVNSAPDYPMGGSELQIPYQEARFQDPQIANALRKNPFKRPQDFVGKVADHGGKPDIPGDAAEFERQMEQLEQMGPSNLASIALPHKQRKNLAQQDRGSSASERSRTSQMKFPGFAKDVASRGTRSFHDSASGLGSYTSSKAGRGSGSYTSPYLIDTPTTRPEPRFELKASEAQQDQADAALPVNNAAAGDMDSLVQEIIAESSTELFRLQAELNAGKSTQRSRKRAAEDSEEEYEPDDDNDEDEKRPARKRARKGAARTNKKTATAQSNRSQVPKNKTIKSSGAGSEPVKRPRGRPRKYPRPDDSVNQLANAPDLPRADTPIPEASMEKAISKAPSAAIRKGAPKKRGTNKPLAKDVTQASGTGATEASNMPTLSASEPVAVPPIGDQPQKGAPKIKLKLKNSKGRMATASAPNKSAEDFSEPSSQSQPAASPAPQQQSFREQASYAQHPAPSSYRYGLREPTLQWQEPVQASNYQQNGFCEPSAFAHRPVTANPLQNGFRKPSAYAHRPIAPRPQQDGFHQTTSYAHRPMTPVLPQQRFNEQVSQSQAPLLSSVPQQPMGHTSQPQETYPHFPEDEFARTPVEARQQTNIPMTQAGTPSQSRPTQYANYQEFREDCENGRKLFHEATLRTQQVQDLMRGYNFQQHAPPGIANVQSTSTGAFAAPNMAVENTAQNPPTRAQRAAQVAAISGQQAGQTFAQDPAWDPALFIQNMTETNSFEIPATTSSNSASEPHSRASLGPETTASQGSAEPDAVEQPFVGQVAS